ncbi:MAG: hypothetical protein IPL63_10825 [Saprospiraceae bacterium]|nr:hypothetical protein [Saprospiraceae bacterium]MBK8818701.1 hypothetical protein [Saprospiraceae bacterium]MBK9042481.1 hypothetical protein [Saprospiraceae bacterium]
MDKTYFKKQSLEEANKHQDFYRQMSDEKRAKAFLLMMQAAYHFVGKEWPKMEKIFSGKRKIHGQ